MTWRHRIGEWLRALAHRIDPEVYYRSQSTAIHGDDEDDQVYGVPGGVG